MILVEDGQNKPFLLLEGRETAHWIIYVAYETGAYSFNETQIHDVFHVQRVGNDQVEAFSHEQLRALFD